MKSEIFDVSIDLKPMTQMKVSFSL
jgi:hypothetical protein